MSAILILYTGISCQCLEAFTVRLHYSDGDMPRLARIDITHHATFASVNASDDLTPRSILDLARRFFSSLP
jgi:hypothetical protein